MAGLIKNFESFLFAFFAILFIIHGIYVINLFSTIKKGFSMIISLLKKIFTILTSCFYKKNKKKTKKKLINKNIKIKKDNQSIKKK